MRRSDFFKRYFAKFLVALLLVGMIVYTLFHALGGSSSSLMTTPARTVTDTQILGGEAYLFREETVLDGYDVGLVEDLVKTGDKVGKDVCLARVWSDCDPADQKELDRLSRLISVLEEGVSVVGEPAIYAQRYKQEANALFLQIKQALAEGRESEVAELEDRMTVCLCRVATLTGNGEEAELRLEALRAQRAALLTGGYSSVYNSQASGYFYNRSYVDGGEELFSIAALKDLTPQSLAQLRTLYTQQDAGAFTVGKMVYSYDWYLAIPYDASVEGILVVGEQYDITFTENRDAVLTLTCERVDVDADGRSLIVFHSNVNPVDFQYLRIQHVEFEVAQRKGYYIPEQALTVQNGVDGVFIFENSTVYFKRIDILFRGDGYCIAAERGDRGSDYLALNDLIVTSGNNLYDGRVFQ